MLKRRHLEKEKNIKNHLIKDASFFPFFGYSTKKKKDDSSGPEQDEQLTQGLWVCWFVSETDKKPPRLACS